MREYKFRGKHKKDWIYGYSIEQKPEETVFILNLEDGMWYEVNPETVGQYTGLKDKNGVEIYEGDIVKVIFGEKNIGKVIYEHSGFIIDVTNMNRPYGRVDFVNNFIKVIGNIYDNPELLKGE